MVSILAIAIQTLKIFARHPFYNEKWWGILRNVWFISADSAWTHLDVVVDRQIFRSGHFPMSHTVTPSFTGKHYDVKIIIVVPAVTGSDLVCCGVGGCLSTDSVGAQSVSTDSDYTAPRTTAVIASPPPPTTLSSLRTTGGQETPPPPSHHHRHHLHHHYRHHQHHQNHQYHQHHQHYERYQHHNHHQHHRHHHHHRHHNHQHTKKAEVKLIIVIGNGYASVKKFY